MWQQLLIWVITYVLTDYFRERLPSQTPSGIGDFDIPTATEGRPVPICTGGTIRIESPNCIWYGDFAAVERTVTTGVIFKREETIGFKYELALQYALFKGPSAGITGIWIGDDQVFDHVDDAGGIPQEFVDVDRDDLFGGEDNGGGFQGRVRLHNGAETQAVSSFLASRLDPLPAYRGLSYIIISNIAGTEFNGWQRVEIDAEVKGATIGEQNRLRYIRVEVQTFDDLAGTAGSPGLGDTLSLGNDHHIIGPDLNPIVAAWDVWTNTRWGRGFGLADVDIASFQAAAETCFAEGIGWTNLQDEQTTTGAIQDKIEQHIDGYIGPNPLTGMIEVTLARPDYVLASLPLIDDSNIVEVKEWDQGDWSNTKNRIRIRYTSRSKDWNETHAVETAAGNRIIQGRTVTEEIRFEGVHTDSVAAVIAAREKRGLSIPLQKGTLVIDRVGYALKPGQPFRLTSIQTKTTDLAVRVTKIGVGDMVRQEIELSVIEDIFGNEPSTVTETPAESDFVPPIQAVIPFGVLDQAATEPPFILQAFDGEPGTTRRITTWASRNPGNNPTFYEVHRRTGNPPAGAYVFSEAVLASFGVYGTLRNAELGAQAGQGTLSIEVDELTGFSLDGLIRTYDPRLDDARGIAVISPGTVDEEFIIFTAVIDSGTGIQLDNVFRSAMDTPWKAHALGAPIWFIWTGGMGLALEQYALNTQVEIKLLPANSEQVLAEASATALPIVTIDTDTDDRTTKPLLPVELDFNGSVFPTTVDFEGLIVPQSGPDYTGAQLIPKHRLATVADVRLSLEGQNALGAPLDAADLADQVLDVSFWMFDLSQNPTPVRADALASTLNQAVVNPNDEIQIEKADLVAGGATGISFPARVEIETRHSPTGKTALNISHEPLFFDFTATGVFTLDADQVIFGAQFNGNDGDTTMLDELARPTLFLGNAQIDTASSVYGGSSLILDGTGDFVWMASPPGFHWLLTEWTIDFRIRFDDIVSAQAIIGQWTSGPRRQWYLEWDGASFQFRFSRNGSDGPFTNIPLGVFSPNAAQWYTLRIVSKNEPTFPRFSLYIDGTRIGSSFVVQSSSQSGVDWLIGGRYDGAGVYSLPFTGQIDELEVRPFAALDPNVTSYTVDTNRPALGPAGQIDALIANFEDADAATAHRTDETSRWDLTFGATTEIDTAQSQFGSSSLRCDGVNNLTPASADGVWIPETLFPTTALRSWDLERQDWTMEAFVRFVSLPSSTTDGMAIISKYNRPSGNTVDWAFSFSAIDDLVFYYSTNGNITGGVSAVSSDLGTLSTGVWYHAIAQRRGDDMELYFNGNRVLQTIGYFAGNKLFNNTSNPVAIGRYYDANIDTRIRAMDGWIDGLRVHVGRAIYSGATYTIPTTPPSAGDQGDRDLLLLHHFEGGDFFNTDRLEETDDLQRSTRITFEGLARYLDGNPKFGVTHGDAGNNAGFSFTPSLFWWDLADGDFTIDLWFYPRDLLAAQANGGIAFFNHWLESGDERGYRFSFDNATDRLEFIWTTDGTAADERTAFVSSVAYDTLFPLNNYVHVAVERESSTLSIYVAGVLQTIDGASDSIGTDVIYNPGDVAPRVAIQDEPSFNGTNDAYWEEFRITKRAAYGGASFTPETSAYTAPTPPNI